jgi:glycosyltransferase involved in cell wall biosynthesis
VLNVLTLSTLFPDASRPNFGPFVAQQTLGLAALDGVNVRIIAPVGLPPFARFHPHYRALAAVPLVEDWQGTPVYRPRFLHLPGTGGRFDAGAMVRAVLPQLKQLRRDFAFDVIDASFFFPDGPAAVALGQALGVPVSIKARGGDIHLWGAQSATQRQIVNAGQRADGLLAVSSALRDDMVAMGMPGQRITVHYTGINRTIFHVWDRAAAKQALGLGTGPLIATIGALIPRKQQDIVLRALVDLPDAQLVVIGAGPARDSYVALANELGITNRVRFTGSLPLAQIADWLAAADVMTLASVSEGLANVWIEALASGTPIVIPDVGGAAEVLDRPAAGRLVAPNPAAFAAAIADILAHPPDRAAVAATVDRFGWDVNAATLHTHLTGLVERYASGAPS